MVNKKKTLSNNIFKWGTFKNSAIPTFNVKEFIEKLKEELLYEDGIYEIEVGKTTAGLIDIKKVFNRIDKLAGDELIKPKSVHNVKKVIATAEGFEAPKGNFHVTEVKEASP